MVTLAAARRARRTRREASTALPKRSGAATSAASRPVTTDAISGGDELQDRGPHEELLEVLRKVADDLLGKVVVELLIGAGHGADEPADLEGRPVSQSRLDELERRCPPFRPRRNVCEDVGLERAAIGLARRAALFRLMSKRRSSVPSSTTSPVARSRASGIDGVRRLANTIENRSGPRAISSLAMARMSGDSSTTWKSSSTRTAPFVGDRRELAEEDVGRSFARRARPCSGR